MPQALFGKRRPGVRPQQFHEAHDMAQWRSQIMGYGVAERLQFLVGGLQLRGALNDALLQFGVQVADLLLRRLLVADVARHL